MRFCKYWAIGAIVITLLSACSDFRQGNSPLPLQRTLRYMRYRVANI